MRGSPPAAPPARPPQRPSQAPPTSRPRPPARARTTWRTAPRCRRSSSGAQEDRSGLLGLVLAGQAGRWVLAHDRWHTGFVDSVGTGGLLAQVEGRSAGVVTVWLADRPAAWREQITHVTHRCGGRPDRPPTIEAPI